MNFKTGSFSPRSDELTEGTQSTASDTSRESSRAGSGTDAARDGPSSLASVETSVMGRKIAKEDSRVGHGRGVRCRKRWMGVAIDELGSVDVAPMAGMERTVGGGVRVIACASSTATSADVRVIVCATSTATSTDVWVSDGQSESWATTCECVFSCAHAAAAAQGEGGGSGSSASDLRHRRSTVA